MDAGVNSMLFRLTLTLAKPLEFPKFVGYTEAEVHLLQLTRRLTWRNLQQ